MLLVVLVGMDLHHNLLDNVPNELQRSENERTKTIFVHLRSLHTLTTGAQQTTPNGYLYIPIALAVLCLALTSSEIALAMSKTN